jgi:hypothetical protein
VRAGKKVIVAGLVDDPDETMPLGLLVLHTFVDLPLLQRRWVAPVGQADDVRSSGSRRALTGGTA